MSFYLNTLGGKCIVLRAFKATVLCYTTGSAFTLPGSPVHTPSWTPVAPSTAAWHGRARPRVASPRLRTLTGAASRKASWQDHSEEESGGTLGHFPVLHPIMRDAVLQKSESQKWAAECWS